MTIPATVLRATTDARGPVPGWWVIAGSPFQFHITFDVDPAGEITLDGTIIFGAQGGRHVAVHAGGDLFEIWHATRDYRPLRRRRDTDGAPVRFRVFRGHIVPESTPTGSFDPDLTAYDKHSDIRTGDTIATLGTDGTVHHRTAVADELAGVHAGLNRFDWFPYTPAWHRPQPQAALVAV